MSPLNFNRVMPPGPWEHRYDDSGPDRGDHIFENGKRIAFLGDQHHEAVGKLVYLHNCVSALCDEFAERINIGFPMLRTISKNIHLPEEIKVNVKVTGIREMWARVWLGGILIKLAARLMKGVGEIEVGVNK